VFSINKEDIGVGSKLFAGAASRDGTSFALACDLVCGFCMGFRDDKRSSMEGLESLSVPNASDVG
jgi:hypothetical protein